VRDDGSYICGATIARADGGEMLRRAVFQISEDGCVEVIEEEVIGDIPTDTPLI
jgi:hypothetical protein